MMRFTKFFFGSLVVRKPQPDDGGCNFCVNKDVSEIEVFSSHPSRGLHVRFCAICAESLREQLKRKNIG